ncbi:MAG: hypothetical protein R3E10_03405 [Gemmatimonadota bacterium]
MALSLTLLVTGLTGAGLGAASAQAPDSSVLQEVRLEVDLRGAQAEAVLTATLSQVRGPVRLRMLAFDDGVPEWIELRLPAGPPTRVPVERNGPRAEALLPLESSDTVRFELRYGLPLRRDSRGDVQVALPVPTVGTAAASARADFFGGDLVLPAGFRVAESFPSVFGDADENGVVRGTLSTVPSLVRVRLRPSDRGRVDGLVVFEAAVVVLIGLLGWAGWRHLSARV